MARFQTKLDMADRTIAATRDEHGRRNRFPVPAQFEEVSPMTLVQKLQKVLNASPISLRLPDSAGQMPLEKFAEEVLQAALRRTGSSEQSLGMEEPEASMNLSMNAFSVTPAQQARRAWQERRSAEAGKAGADAFFDLIGGK